MTKSNMWYPEWDPGTEKSLQEKKKLRKLEVERLVTNTVH